MNAVFSSAHRRIAEAILSFEREQEPPFMSDLVRQLGYAAESSLTATLRLMERNGLVVIQGGGEKGRSRVVRLTAKARFALGAGGIPFLGTIPAGPLEEALAQANQIMQPPKPVGREDRKLDHRVCAARLRNFSRHKVGLK